VKNPIRNETSLVLVIAVIFSGIAIPVLSGFLEPSQPPAVAAVQIGGPKGRDAPAPKPMAAPQHEREDNSAGRGEGSSAGEDEGSSAGEDENDAAGDVRGRRSVSSSRERPAQPAEPAPAPPADDVGEDDDAD
jgi:hypothetical protein